MSGDDCTFSVGVIEGGQWVNCVASSCTAQALSMAKRQQDLDSGVEKMLALSTGDNKDASGDVTFHVSRGVTRPVWEPDEACKGLFEHAQRLAKDIGFHVEPNMSGGGSDGNFTGAIGIPTLDSLGAIGAGPVSYTHLTLPTICSV